jgi:DNA-binding MarR family transcriptional regulator
MHLQDQRELRLLDEVARDGAVSQRTLAKNLHVALGLANLYVKRLVRKGYIKTPTISHHRIHYLLTTRGMAEKSRLTYLYMQYALSHYRDVRGRLKHGLSDLAQAGGKRMVIYGTGELAELAYLSVREMNMTLVGFVDDKPNQIFLSYPVWPLDRLANWDFDGLLIADLDEREKIHARILREGVPKAKIMTL